MKKYTAILVAAVAVLLIAGNKYYADVNGPLSKIRIATGGESWIYYAYGDALAEALEQRMNIPVTAIPSGGSVDNIHMLKNRKAEIAFVQNDIMTYAYNGAGIFSTEGEFKDFSAIAGLYPETCQIVARRDIADITGLKGRRVSIGAEGSGTELNALQILEAYGMKYTDVDVDHLGFAASVTAFRDGKIDAFFCTAGIPTPAISELAAGGEARLLSIGDAHARSIISLYPYYSRQAIPKDAYPGIGEETETVAVKATLVASNKLSEQAITEILKMLFDGEALGTLPGNSSPSREFAVESLPIPLHPGAYKYFFGR